MILGAAVMLICGICTVVFSFSVPSDALVFLVIGGIPFVLGVGLYKLGNHLRSK